MWIFVLLLASVLTLGAGQNPEYQLLERAYADLQAKQYDGAVQSFLAAIKSAPKRADVRKDLAYTYLKIGENELAREQFRLSMELEPSDTDVAMEFAFLCYEARDNAIPARAEARRIFDRIRKTGNATAEQAFQNIDQPLKIGIERWTQALAISPESFSAHYELAQLAEQRDELGLAEAQYLRAWQMLPGRKAVLIDLGRVEQALGNSGKAIAALLAASRGGEPRAADRARELLPPRYPYVYEFRAALALDPSNQELHRELAFLLLAMKDPGAEKEFRKITVAHPDDLIAAAQLGFLLTGEGDAAAAMPLRPTIDPFAMAKKSLDAGFLKDALRYLIIAHESDPDNDEIVLKLGWTYNMLHDDRTAEHWFDLARRSENRAVAGEAERAYQNLKGSLELFRTTAWVLPFYSSRWNDVFAYGQVKSELNLSKLRIRPYLSVRLIADTKPAANNQALSERSFIVGGGLSARWRRFTAWGEAGSAVSYIKGGMLPDYRGGLSWARNWTNERGFLLEANADEVFISRFGNDFLSYVQSRAGWHWIIFNANLTADINRQHWANFVEVGPGFRIHPPNTPKNLMFSANFLRGVYLINDGIPKHSNFNDLRVGFWYAITK